MDLVGTWSLYGWAVASSIICLIAIDLFRKTIILSQQHVEENDLSEQQQLQQSSSICHASCERHRRTLPLHQLLKATLNTYYSVAFFVAYFTLSVGMSVVENMIFLFYETALRGSNTMLVT